jgi:hypothetical protein
MPCSKLEAAGVATLGQLLDCFPSRLITSLPGRLPQEGDTDPVVTLAARTAKKPVGGRGSRPRAACTQAVIGA